MPSGTNIARKLRKLERLVRRAFEHTTRADGTRATLDGLILHCQQHPGTYGRYSITNSVARDILKTLSELDDLKEQTR